MATAADDVFLVIQIAPDRLTDEITFAELSPMFADQLLQAILHLLGHGNAALHDFVRHSHSSIESVFHQYCRPEEVENCRKFVEWTTSILRGGSTILM